MKWLSIFDGLGIACAVYLSLFTATTIGLKLLLLVLASCGNVIGIHFSRSIFSFTRFRKPTEIFTKEDFASLIAGCVTFFIPQFLFPTALPSIFLAIWHVTNIICEVGCFLTIFCIAYRLATWYLHRKQTS
ncbi:hypothetical protein OQI89_06480 [Lentilactobacillus diolivorans]|uniref:hypothetical protein n=1 Tax=Lentilactobacillus diolivorans TaxID=179838 RepID=UPI0024683C18|nr:hypothetical protein [Lentilactobacillus diolivorans]MDH5105493.1 hypothetical protein [Lentilactobacillus diolivorans]